MKLLPVRQRGVCCEIRVEVDADAIRRSAELLKALADPTRLAMLAALRRADMPICVCDFTAAFDLSQPTISHHMGKLKQVGLVDSTKRGVWTYYELREDCAAPVRKLLDDLFALETTSSTVA